MSQHERVYERMKRKASTADVERVEGRLPKMERGPLKEIWPKVRALWAFVKDPKVPFREKVPAIAALVYLVSPLDAVPDVIPGVGLLDDVAVILSVVMYLWEILKGYLRPRAGEDPGAIAEVEIKKHVRIVTISVVGAVVIAVLAIAVKLAWPYLPTPDGKAPAPADHLEESR